jgi:hypothetical protein
MMKEKYRFAIAKSTTVKGGFRVIPALNHLETITGGVPHVR